MHNTATGPMQRVLPDAPLPAILALDGCDDDAFAAAIEAEGSAQVAALLSAPEAALFHVSLLRRSASVAVLVCTVHHAVLDAFAMTVIIEDLFALYFGKALPPPPLQYCDIARLEAARLASAGAERAFAFWREDLAKPAVTAWPAGPDHVGGATFHILNDATIAAAEATGRRAGAGLLAMLLAAAWASLAPRLGPQIRLGVPVANRAGAAERASVGLLAHSLPLRLDLSDAASGLDAVQMCGRALRIAFRHGRIPVSALIERLRPDEYGLPHELSPAQVNLFPWKPAQLPGGLALTPLLQRPVATGALNGLNLFAGRLDGVMLLSIGHAGPASAADAEAFSDSFAGALARLTDEPRAKLV